MQREELIDYIEAKIVEARKEASNAAVLNDEYAYEFWHGKLTAYRTLLHRL